MTAESTTMTYEEIVARNLAAVEDHFHNENPDDIDKAVALYTDDVVWEVPARGLVYRDHETVKQEYLRIFEGTQIHKITRLHQFANEEWVFDDSVFELTTGPGFRNALYPAGTKCSVRILHAFQLRDGKICRENGYEIWRRWDDETRVNDDIPPNALVTVFD